MKVENYNGQAVISIQYMYQYANGGSGTNLEINKNTGEIIQYYDVKSQILEDIGEKPEKGKTLYSKGSPHSSNKIYKGMGSILFTQLCYACRRTIF